ncbi:hypothetical protein ACIBCN_19060 [Nocardia sp. NPDC051052]|uniref:hypothetical protein n=1 Tax=Nocardia sp. NPDC051052 TaxID=3364322 RepID=UPI0037B5832D
MPVLPQVFSETAYFDADRHPTLDAEGPVNGQLSVHYERSHANHSDHDAHGIWLFVIDLSPSTFNADHESVPDAERPLMISSGRHTGNVQLVAEDERTRFDPVKAGTLWTDGVFRIGFGAQPMTPLLAEFARQVLAYWHTPQRLHDAKIVHTMDELHEIGATIADLNSRWRTVNRRLADLTGYQP